VDRVPDAQRLHEAKLRSGCGLHALFGAKSARIHRASSPEGIILPSSMSL
jgi:hypothetical protein